MRRIGFTLGLVVAALVAVSGCTDQQPAIQQVGTNIVDKSVFTDSWYYSRTVIDVDYEGSALGTFPGDTAIDIASGLTSLPRIRWVIDEDTLYAYRDYELVEGAEGVPQEPGTVLGHPVAAFSIDRHFDIRRTYNTATGEEQNVIIENDFDRLWFERQYMRVDWSQNLLPGFYGQIFDLFAVIGQWNRESAPLLIQDNSQFPETWTPQFHYMTCDGPDDTSERCLDEDRDWASDYELGELFHMSFVTQDILSPGTLNTIIGELSLCSTPFIAGGPNCSSVSVFIRNSFLKVSDQREYEPVNFVDTRFERHGYFRLERPTFDRSTGPDDPAFGATDFLNYSANRHNIWRDWFDDEGNPIPYADREVRPIVWYMTPETPAHIVKPFYEIVGEWNGVLVETVRTLQGRERAEYAPVECQETDPDSYCFCKFDDAGNRLNPTCAGRYDVFTPPEEANVVSGEPIDCYVRMTDGSNVFGDGGAEPDLMNPRLSDQDFYRWFDTEMVGTECATLARVNSCNRASVAAAEDAGEAAPRCEERGDMRFKFLSYVDQPGTPFLGIATMRGDPVTGEILTGDANVGGPAFDLYRTFALQTYDLERGDLLEDPFTAGEDVRQYLENLNRTDMPAVTLPSFHADVLEHAGAATSNAAKAIDNVMTRALPRMRLLEGPEGAANTMMDRLFELAQKEPDLERRLMANPEMLLAAGIEQLPAGMTIEELLTEDFLNGISPFRTNIHDIISEYADTDDLVASRNVLTPNEYVDNSVTRYATDRERLDWPRARLEFGLNRYLVLSTQLHEMGHTLGLRHSFASSADTANYHDDYYVIDAAFPLPDPTDPEIVQAIELEVGERQNGVLDTTAENNLFEQQYEEVRQRRRLAGISQTNNASIMDYAPEWYSDAPRRGRYDNAAVAFGYGDLVEIIDNVDGVPAGIVDENGDPIIGADGEPILRSDTLANPLNADRVWARYYLGGEVCAVDSDCPFASDGARSAELTDVNQAAGLTQTCQPHPNPEVSGAGICSNFDEDAAALVAGQVTPRYAPVEYQFCTDNRAAGGGIGSIGICNRWDDGENYREIVRNVNERYQRNYLWENFRRYRRGYRTGSLGARFFSRRFILTQNIYQNLLFRYAEEPEFRRTTGPFGFYDQFMATVDVMNTYARILGSPWIGSYSYTQTVDEFEWNGTELGEDLIDLRLQDGARYGFSVFQDGLTGLQRVERVGNFLEKAFAMQLLTIRGWQPFYSRDSPFLLNFYDIFPVEMTQIIGGMIRDEPTLFAPRVQCADGTAGDSCEDPQIIYPNFYRGDCLSDNPAGCRPAPQETEFGELDVLDGFSNGLLRQYAYLFGMSQFTTFFDTTFQNQTFVCVEGFGDCPEPDPNLVEGEDFVRFQSERFLASVIAYKATVGAEVEGESIGFDMLTELKSADGLYRRLQKFRGDFDDGIPDLGRLTEEDREFFEEANYPLPRAGEDVSNEITRLRNRAFNLEGFVNLIVNWQRQLGIQRLF